MDIERPLVEEPLVEQQWNNPPEIPDERFTMMEPVAKFRHMMVAKSPVSEVGIIVKAVINCCEN